MTALRIQYFLTYAVMGSMLPYVSVYFRQRGLSQVEIGYVLGASSLALVLSPVLVTLLADMRLDARKLMAGLFALAAVASVALRQAQGFTAILAWWCVHAIVFVPVMPLKDGINFALQHRRKAQGLAEEPYHRIRVWGTVGFIVPSVLIWGLLYAGLDVGLVLWWAAGFAALGALNALRLPDAGLRRAPNPAAALPGEAHLPTLAALRALRRRPVLIFCLAMFLLHMASAAYYGFYPIYLTEQVGIDLAWVGLIANVGVVVEIFFMLSYGRLLERIGLKNVILLGLGCTAARMALLAALPNPGVAVGTQLFHGMQVLALHVVPPVFVNRHADPRFRHSLQGLFTMLVVGLGRIVGNLVAGPVAQWSLTGVLAWAGGLCALAALLVLVGFRDGEREPRRHEGITDITSTNQDRV